MSHAEVATDMQDRRGGSYQYVHRTLEPLVGSIVGWGLWVGLIFATAFYATGFARYLTLGGQTLKERHAPAAPLVDPNDDQIYGHLQRRYG